MRKLLFVPLVVGLTVLGAAACDSRVGPETSADTARPPRTSTPARPTTVVTSVPPGFRDATGPPAKACPLVGEVLPAEIRNAKPQEFDAGEKRVRTCVWQLTAGRLARQLKLEVRQGLPISGVSAAQAARKEFDIYRRDATSVTAAKIHGMHALPGLGTAAFAVRKSDAVVFSGSGGAAAAMYVGGVDVSVLSGRWIVRVAWYGADGLAKTADPSEPWRGKNLAFPEAERVGATVARTVLGRLP